MPVARILLNMLLFKAAPQDLPYSLGLLNRVLLIYLLSGLVVHTEYLEPADYMAQSILGLVITLFFTYILLASLDLKARFVQTMSALIGVGIYFNLLLWPLMMQLGKDELSDSEMGMISLVYWLLIIWSLAVTAHIYRHALNASLVHAIIVSVALFFLSVTLLQMFFPENIS